MGVWSGRGSRKPLTLWGDSSHFLYSHFSVHVVWLGLLKRVFLLKIHRRKKMMDSEYLYALGLTLVFVGIILIVITLVLLSASSAKATKFRGGGAVIIGPVPIIFGTDSKSLKTVLLLSLALTVLIIALIIIQYLLLK